MPTVRSTLRFQDRARRGPGAGLLPEFFFRVTTRGFLGVTREVAATVRQLNARACCLHGDGAKACVPFHVLGAIRKFVVRRTVAHRRIDAAGQIVVVPLTTDRQGHTVLSENTLLLL